MCSEERRERQMTNETVVVNRITGNKFIVGGPARKSAFSSLRYPEIKTSVVGLKAEDRGTSIRFTFESADEITAADAVDAQCRAGWNDLAYNFWGFIAEQGDDGRWTANWACSKCGE